MSENDTSVRLDKWLWAARIYKTRTLAKAAIESGRVYYNKSRVKPSKIVELGVELRLQLGWDEKTIIVDGINGRRVSAELAQAMYTETPESIERREQQSKQRKALGVLNPKSDSKPNKRERRSLLKIKTQFNSDV